MPPSWLQEHWDATYGEGDATKSWMQQRPVASLAMIEAALEARKSEAIIDIGGGSSSLASELVAGGYRDVTVLDLSASALQLAQQRMGAYAGEVEWIVADLLSWQPQREYALWHDRATLHFFLDDSDRGRYAQTARLAIQPGGYAVIATFALDGPTECSGLSVCRSSADEIAQLLGDEFALVGEHRKVHRTPGGAEQPFTWAVLRRAAT